MLRRTTCTQQLFDIVVSQSPEPEWCLNENEAPGNASLRAKQPQSTEPPTGADRARVQCSVAPIPSGERRVLKSSPHAQLRSGTWMTVQNMDCMITHLWTKRRHNDRCTRQDSSVNSVVFRKFHRDSTRGCWDHLHTVRSKVVRDGTEKHMEHIAINQ